MDVKIIQLLWVPETQSYHSELLGLGSDGVTYIIKNCEWVEHIPNVVNDENN